MASSPNTVNFPRFSPPPPPPHIVPPPPPSSPENDTTVIVVVFVSFGGLFFLGLLAIAVCCFIKRRNKKMVKEDEIVRVDEHLKVKEAIVEGPHGREAVVISIEDDVKIEEEIEKTKTYGQAMHAETVENTAGGIEEAPSSSSSHHHFTRKP